MSDPCPDVATVARALLTESLYTLYPAARRPRRSEPATRSDPADPVVISGTAWALLDTVLRATSRVAVAYDRGAPETELDAAYDAFRRAEHALMRYLAQLETPAREEVAP
jgi:hypothetical protein